MKQLFLFHLIIMGLFSLPCNASGYSVSGNVNNELQQSTKTISGTVTDENGEPIVGATIILEGTIVGTATDAYGKFTINAPTNATLKISYLGYLSQQIAVGSKSVFNITLKEDSKTLDEVVIIGYEKMKKGDVTSAVSSIRSDDFIKGDVKDITQLIQGKVAGLTVINPSGDPTKGTEILLRGVTTLRGDASPLILIDGVPGNLNSIAPADIEAIDILKDGSAAAIYGTRGTNGVIIITTKKARNNTKATLSYSGKVSTQTIASKLDFMSADQYRKQMKDSDGFVDWGHNTDWLGEITRTPISHEHNISLSAGGQNSNVIANLNIKDSEGIFLKTGVNDLRGRIDASFKLLNDIVTVNTGLIASQRKYWPGFNNEIYRQAIMRNPTDYVKEENGVWADRPDVYWYYNPVQTIHETQGEYKQNYIQMNGSITLDLFSGLNTKLLFSRELYDSSTGTYQTRKHSTTIREGRNGVASLSSSKAVRNLLEWVTNYRKQFDKHNISILGGYSYQDAVNESFSASNWNFRTDTYSYNKLEAGAALKEGKAGMSSSKNSNKLIGFFARTSYNFNEKYLLMGSLRYEGSSKFGDNHKWGLFPAVSAGWRIKEESFMKDIRQINDLKLRVGYGVTGIDVSSSYQSKSSVNYDLNNQFWTSEGGWVPQLIPVRNPNQNLRWERKKEINMGVDYSFLSNRLYGTIDVYQRETTDALWEYEVPMPPYVYSRMDANVGVLRNKGIEISVGGIPVKTEHFMWNTVVNFSTNTNKLVSLSNDEFKSKSEYIDQGSTGEPIQALTHRMEVGGKIGNFYGLKVVDIDNDGIWIVERPDGERISYKDHKPEDKQVIGNGLPKYYLGWNNTFHYKNFDLDINMRGAFGFQVLNFPRMYYENPKLAMYNRLTSAMDPIFGKNVELKNDLAYVSYYLEDADYLKIDNIAFGYNFKLRNIKELSNLRLFFSCTNLLTISGYKGVDPEVNSLGLSPGNDSRDKYPTTRTFTLGLNVTF